MGTAKYILTEERKQIMMSCYDSETWTVTALMQGFGVPRDTISKWAIKLGLTHAKRAWTQEEEEYLRVHACNQTVAKTATVLHRTRAAIKNKCNRMRITQNIHGYSLNEIAEGLGCNRHKVHRWIKRGWIPARGRVQGRWKCNISDNAIRAFLLEHAEEVSEEAMQSLWVQDLLHSEYGMGPLVQDRSEEAL